MFKGLMGVLTSGNSIEPDSRPSVGRASIWREDIDTHRKVNGENDTGRDGTRYGHV